MSGLEILKEEKIISLLLLLKISPNLKGFRYLKRGAMIIIDDPNKKFQFRRRLYKDLASEFHEKEEIIDRSMRHALQVCYRNGGVEDFEREKRIFFSYCNPSPREVIIMIAETVLMEMNKFVENPEKCIERWKEKIWLKFND